MAFSEFEQALHTKTLTKFIEDIRPPLHMRKEIDIKGTLINQTIEIHEFSYLMDKVERISFPVAKVTYIRTKKLWSLFWIRSSGKWEKYDEFERLEQALSDIKQDRHECFFG